VTVETNPLMNTRAERMRIEAVLKHLGTGADLREFPGTASEKVALVRTATHRGLVVWNRGRNRCELTSAGWCELAPNRRFGAGSMMLGTTVGATLGAAALAIFWFAAGTSHGQLAPRPGVASAPAQQRVATVSRPAVGGALSSAGPLAQASAVAVAVQSAPAAPPPPTPAVVPAHEAVPAAAPPAAAAEPTKVADEPTPEELEAAAKAKQVAAKKARQRAAARRQREEAARAWAADPRTQQAEYSGYGGHSAYRGYGGYGGQSSWFAYR
jgi:hypothetical protein